MGIILNKKTIILTAAGLAVPGLSRAIILNTPLGQQTTIENFAQYISAWYQFIIGSVGVLAVLMIMWAGFRWLTSRGNQEIISDAKDKIWSAIIGLVLVFLIYTISFIINPELTKIELPELPTAEWSAPSNADQSETDQSETDQFQIPSSSNGMTEAVNRYLALRQEIEQEANDPNIITQDEIGALRTTLNGTYQRLQGEYPEADIYFLPGDITRADEIPGDIIPAGEGNGEGNLIEGLNTFLEERELQIATIETFQSDNGEYISALVIEEISN